MDKLCTACKHSTPRSSGSGVTFCLHDNNITISSVDGQPEMVSSCESLRANGDKCGRAARWYAAKS